ncbi:MAG: right-handed parallel beta-helix repeat-containing protein [Bryobacterales bacterium]|nr:right-handed parallel beta-helix repeat-containing protein [Bryobacterales bacterium]
MLQFLLFCTTASALAQPSVGDPRAVERVLSGKSATANAAWWGFSTEDSTAALQAAIDSGAKRVIVPYMGEPWIVTPIRLRGNQELYLEPGVVILAKKGAFHGGGDSLLTASGVDNLTIRGYGASLRMRKADYQKPPYTKAEWRMGLALRGVKNVRVEGLRSESSGGDGFYIDGNGTRGWSEDVVFKDCEAHDNHRQGMSVISAVNLTVEHCRFSKTGGTAPEAGLDLEPDTETQRLQNVLVRNSVFEQNSGDGVLVYLRPLSAKSAPVSIRFENCLMRGGNQGGRAGIRVSGVKDDGPQGTIEFVDCVTEDTGRESAGVTDKSSKNVKVRFVNCHFRNPWQSAAPAYAGPRVPIHFELRRPEIAATVGQVEFADCYVHDPVERPVLRLESIHDGGLADVHGVIFAPAAKSARVRLGLDPKNTDIKAVAGRPAQ